MHINSCTYIKTAFCIQKCYFKTELRLNLDLGAYNIVYIHNKIETGSSSLN